MQRPLTDSFAEKLESLCSGAASRAVAVALSGGPDSLALTLLLQAHCPDLVALTIDHGLRKESAAEAESVAAMMRRRKIAHVTLKIKAKPPTANFMEWARRQRYALLLKYCREHGIADLFVAHQLADQVETFFLNLERGSGLRGLGGMQEISVVEGVRIIRPLLEVPKPALEAYLRKKRMQAIVDPTNENLHFKRNRLRQGLAEIFAENAVLPERVAQAMRHLRQADGFIAVQVEQAVLQLFQIEANGVRFSHSHFVELHPLLKFHVLLRGLMLVSGKAKPPRAEQIEALIQRISEDAKAFTLHGVRGAKKKAVWLLSKEKVGAPS